MTLSSQVPAAAVEQSELVQPNVVLVIGSLQGGGAERVLSDMANYWASKEWRITLATWVAPNPEDFYVLDPRVDRVWFTIDARNKGPFAKILAHLRSMWQLRMLVSRVNPDAVLSFINTSNVLTILSTIGLNPRIVVSERIEPAADPNISIGWRLLRRICYRWADAIVAQSAEAAAWIKTHCRKEAVIVQNPLRPLPTVTRVRQPLIIAIGRLAYQKGFDLLIRAFSQVASDFEEWTVTIIGDGEQRGNLERLCDELTLTDRVEFVGRVRDVEAWIARASLVVQPSRYEGFPNAVLESMAMGATVISADCPSGPSDIIKDGVDGRLVPVDDIDTLASVMADLMAQPELRKALGMKAATARQRFRQDVIMPFWEECLLAAKSANKQGSGES